jgi:membrane associated rhomboid family serine protease
MRSGHFLFHPDAQNALWDTFPTASRLTLNPPREPVLTLPRSLTAVIVLLALIHLGRDWLTPDADERILQLFAFVPARYDMTLLASLYPGGIGAKIWTFFSYAFLHGDWTHLALNVLWLLPFGSAVARRFGALRFCAFLAVTAAAGAAAHLVTYAHSFVPMIGASAAVSGAMAAATRFAFMQGSFLAPLGGDADAAARVPALPLLQSLRNGRVLAFVVIWFAMNLIFGVGSFGVGMQVQAVAWQAHIGGFIAGLLLFSAFDPVPPHRDAAPALD